MTASKTKPATLLRVWTIVFLFIAMKAAGNLSLAWGMKHFPQAMSANPIPFIQSGSYEKDNSETCRYERVDK